MFNRKLRIWDFSSKFIVRRKIIDTFYSNKPGYNAQMKKFGVWTKESLIDLGPTFIKIGQTLSSRSDLFPKEYLEQLIELQDNVPAVEIRVDTSIFKTFDLVPYKSASLGQLHKATLENGLEVAVKIQRPGIKEIIQQDFITIESILNTLEFLRISTGSGSTYLFKESRKTVLDELDYRLEAHNATLFKRFFEKHSWIVIPRVYRSKSTETMLIMEWVDGTKITNINELSREFDTKKISEYLVKSFILQTMDFGFFHADPHPGNIAVTKNGRLVFYDFGLVSKIPPEIQNKSRDIITYIFQKKTRELVDLFIDIGLIIPDTKNKFEITLFFDSILNYVDKNQNDDTLKQIILDKLSQERPFIIPGSFIFLAKTFTLLDGICQQLDPEFTFINYLQPYIEESVDINLSQIAFQSINMPSKINDISNTMYNLQQQRLELNKRFEQLYSNQYILFHLLMLYNLIITLLY